MHAIYILAIYTIFATQCKCPAIFRIHAFGRRLGHKIDCIQQLGHRIAVVHLRLFLAGRPACMISAVRHNCSVAILRQANTAFIVCMAYESSTSSCQRVHAQLGGACLLWDAERGTRCERRRRTILTNCASSTSSTCNYHYS